MQVVNFKDYGSKEALTEAFGDRWLYVGRAMPSYDLPASPLANPVRLAAEIQRGDVLQLYRQWLWAKIQKNDLPVMTALQGIRPDAVLVCWCAPKPCHADILCNAVTWLARTSSAKSAVR